MSILTPFFNLFKLQKTDDYDISQFNANMGIIDTEMHKPPLSVNNIEPDPVSRDIQIRTVPLADNLTSDEMQLNTGTYIIRSSGGEAPIKNGSAVLSEIHGNMVKTGYVPESLNINVTIGDDHLSITYNRETFVEEVTSSGTIVFNYTSSWNLDPATYGITVDGTPVNGDQITAVYVKGDRGTIETASPTAFVSTGWNLYNHSAGYARVVRYSEEYGFMISGNYTTIKFAETLTGDKVTITPINGYFTLPAGASDGYVFLTGGNATNTAIWMTWSDWTEQPNDGVYQPYEQTSVDLTGVMVYFPNGLMRIGNVFDEINLNTLRAYSRIERMEYSAENLAAVIASGLPYDTDTGYIYAVKETPANYSISIDGGYTANDHGTEMFIGTSVGVTASSFYGNDLKNKLRTDVLTISQQTLSAAQKGQVLENIGAVPVSFAEVKEIPVTAVSSDTRLTSCEITCYRTGNIVSLLLSTRWDFSTDNFEEGDTVTITLSGQPTPIMIARNISMHSARIMVVTLTGDELAIRELKGTNTSNNAPIFTSLVYITNDP